MNINEQEVAKLRAMLESYKQKNGTVALGSPESMNMNCTYCTGTCNNFCTHSCDHYCNGNNDVCWKASR
jgi:hypothetical protein